MTTGNVFHAGVETLLSCFTSAVQQERKPSDKEKLSPTMVATSTQKIYIRKDLQSPSTAIPMFNPRVCILTINDNLNVALMYSHEFFSFNASQLDTGLSHIFV